MCSNAYLYNGTKKANIYFSHPAAISPLSVKITIYLLCLAFIKPCYKKRKFQYKKQFSKLRACSPNKNQSIYLSIYLSIHLSLYMSVYLCIDICILLYVYIWIYRIYFVVILIKTQKLLTNFFVKRFCEKFKIVYKETWDSLLVVADLVLLHLSLPHTDPEEIRERAKISTWKVRSTLKYKYFNKTNQLELEYQVTNNR